MDDLISRSALLEEFGEGPYFWFKYDDAEIQHHNDWLYYMDCVKKAPAVDAEKVFEAAGLVKEAFEMAKSTLAPAQKWISVKDRLPEDVLADKDTKVIHCLVALKPPRSQPKRKPLVTKAQRQWNSYTKHWEWGRVYGVIYWMPLPEPPKEG